MVNIVLLRKATVADCNGRYGTIGTTVSIPSLIAVRRVQHCLVSEFIELKRISD